jgi:hypothetical protein
VESRQRPRPPHGPLLRVVLYIEERRVTGLRHLARTPPPRCPRPSWRCGSSACSPSCPTHSLAHDLGVVPPLRARPLRQLHLGRNPNPRSACLQLGRGVPVGKLPVSFDGSEITPLWSPRPDRTSPVVIKRRAVTL